MAVFKRGNIWWYEFTFNAQRIRESTKSTSKNVAVNAERKCRRELEEGHNGLKKRNIPKTFASAANEWLLLKTPTLAKNSLRIEKTNLSHLFTVFGKMLLSDIQPNDISRYQTHRLKENASPKTINLEIGTLRAVLKRYRFWANLQQDVSMLPPNRDEVGRSISPEEQSKLLSACLKSRSRSLYPITVLALNTGMRSSEIRLLKWKQIDLDEAAVTVGRSKTEFGTGRTIPLNHFALSCFRKWSAEFPNRQSEHYVFPSERYGASGDGFLPFAYNIQPDKPIGSFKTSWETVKREAGLKFRFHDLRHTACTKMLETNKPFSVVATIMGWSPATAVRMTRRYGHIGQQAQRDAVGAMSSMNTHQQEVLSSESLMIN